MKKIFSCLLIFVSLFACVLLLPNKVNSSNANNLICSAETTQATQNVNFYGADNKTLLYTAQVPYGSTLNSVKSRNLWSVGDISGTLFKEINLTSPIPAGNYMFSCVVNSSDTDGSISQAIVYGTSGSAVRYMLLERNTRVCTHMNSKEPISKIVFYASGSYVDSVDDTFSYTDIQINLGSTQLPYEHYFDNLNDYVNEQYLKSAGVNDLSTPVSWSTSKESNNMFPFNVPITQDYNLYGYINDGETIEYKGNITSRMSDIGNYAISDIVSLNIDGQFFVSFDMTIRVGDVNSFFTVNVPKDTYSNVSNVRSFVFNSNNEYIDFNFWVGCESLMSIRKFPISSKFDQLIFSVDNSSSDVVLSFLFTNYANVIQTSTSSSFNSNSIYSKETNYMFIENTDTIVDMNSNTNFAFGLISEDRLSPYYNHGVGYLSYELFFNFLELKNDNLFYFNISDLSSTSVSDSELYYATSDGAISNKISCGFSDFFVDNVSDYNAKYWIHDFYFIVDKPTYRVNNALVIYNFDYYNSLSSSSHLVYELSRNGNYYDIFYDGTLPNYKYIFVDNEEINNTIFDRYIFFHMNFMGNYIDLLDGDNFKSYSLGFDFNFAYYVEPLISDASTFEYDFDKPKYKDTGDIFNINWLAVVYNIVVFIAFYMPLVSQVFEMLGLNYFFGGLLNVISFIFDNPLGNFLLGCLAFIIFFKLMLWFWPMAYQVGKSAVQSTPYYKSRQLEKDYQNYSANRRKYDYMKNRYDSENKKE